MFKVDLSHIFRNLCLKLCNHDSNRPAQDIATIGIVLCRQHRTKVLFGLPRYVGSSVSLLFAYDIKSISHDVAQ